VTLERYQTTILICDGGVSGILELRMQGDDILKAELKQAIAECERLRAENAQLKGRPAW